jgi:ABC-type methionine transport system permease subunit
MVEIMLIDATNGLGILGGGGMGKVPINDESFKRPTPTFS